MQLFILAALLCISFPLSACTTPNAKVAKSGFYFDTIITITLYGTGEESYIDECFSMAKHYEDLFSNTVEGSDVWNINEYAGEYVTVSDETVELIEIGMKYGDLSNGVFDITLGKLSELWNISDIAANLVTENNEADESVLPSPEEIGILLPHINYKNIQIDKNRVCLTDPDAMLDLGGIAKGYIADRMKEYLNEAGITSGTIDLGGNILTIGEKSDGTAYTIGIQKPFEDSGEVIATVKVKDKTVVSSGVYQRYYRVDGKLYHHILDLSTGYPYDNDLYEVTIICDSSTDGDALSTICFCLGLEDGMALVESIPDTEAIFITSNYEIYKTTGIGTDIPFSERN